MKRNEVPEKYKWRLEDIFASVADFEREFGAVNKAIPSVLKFKGRLGIKESFCECMQTAADLDLRISKLYCYASCRRDENGADDAASVLYARMQNILTAANTAQSFITPELSALDDRTLGGFIDDPELKQYRYMLEIIRRDKKHILSAAEERVLALGSNALSGYSDVFNMINNVDMPFPKVDFGGKREPLTHGKYSLMLASKDQSVRKKGFDAMYKAVGCLINTTCANYSASVVKDNFLAEVRGYKSAVQKSALADDVPVEIYGKLIECVGRHLSEVHDYVALRKDALGLEKLHMYDLYTPIVEECDISCDYEQAFETVKRGLSPLGDEYAQLLQRAYDERWIDVCETEGKRSGAYSLGIYGVHPYVLLNYSRTAHDIFTIAHELGHSMHSYYSNKAQDIMNADYSIFVAEVASTVNEVLLLKHMLANSGSVAEKKYLLSYYLDMLRTTLFRQTMFAEFELFTHKAQQSGKALTVESMSKEYMKLNKKYYGPAVVHDKSIRYEWARIPHFYRAFYVYKYATGITGSVSIARNILNGGDEAVRLYKDKFLSAGGSKSPYEILRDTGVDLMTDAPYESVMQEFGDTLRELKALYR